MSGKQKIRGFVCKNSTSKNYGEIVSLSNFDKNKLKVTVHDYESSNFYPIDYIEDEIFPLYLDILEFYGHVEVEDDDRYLIITHIENNSDVLSNFKKVCESIIDNINKISNTKYVFKDEYHKIKISNIKCINDVDKFKVIPAGDLLKFSFIIVSCKLVIEKDNELSFKIYLQQCFCEVDEDDDDGERSEQSECERASDNVQASECSEQREQSERSKTSKCKISRNKKYIVLLL